MVESLNLDRVANLLDLQFVLLTKGVTYDEFNVAKGRAYSREANGEDFEQALIDELEPIRRAAWAKSGQPEKAGDKPSHIWKPVKVMD